MFLAFRLSGALLVRPTRGDLAESIPSRSGADMELTLPILPGEVRAWLRSRSVVVLGGDRAYERDRERLFGSSMCVGVDLRAREGEIEAIKGLVSGRIEGSLANAGEISEVIESPDMESVEAPMGPEGMVRPLDSACEQWAGLQTGLTLGRQIMSKLVCRLDHARSPDSKQPFLRDHLDAPLHRFDVLDPSRLRRDEMRARLTEPIH